MVPDNLADCRPVASCRNGQHRKRRDQRGWKPHGSAHPEIQEAEASLYPDELTLHGREKDSVSVVTRAEFPGNGATGLGQTGAKAGRA